jgi:diguanylate cyclase (GGDEF)-like protein
MRKDNQKTMTSEFNVQALLEELKASKEKNARLEEENAHLKNLSIRDELTGLLNLRGFNEVMHPYVAEKKRIEFDNNNKKPMNFNQTQDPTKGDYLVFIDATKFKHINDTYGHEIGDKALVLIAANMQLNARETDFVIRKGGDEFCILFKEATEESVQNSINRIKEALKNTPLETKKGAIHVGIDAGFTKAAINPNLSIEDNVKIWIKTADDKMYENKANNKLRTLSPAQEIIPTVNPCLMSIVK